MTMKRILGISALLMLTTLINCNDELKGSNVCNRTEVRVKQVSKPKVKEYDERKEDWCLSPSKSFRCSTKIRKTEVSFETENVTEIIEISQCCDGYGKNKMGTRCLPLCDCLDDTATYTATEEACNCVSGEKCKFKCPPNHFGENCSKICACKQHGTCNHISGVCNCARGYGGTFCEQLCPPGMCGRECKEECNCLYGVAKCNETTEVNDNSQCPTGTYGPACSLKCECKNGAECVSKTGQCHCTPGWTGHSCTVPCPDGYYGQSCYNMCLCENNATCRKNDGYCSCQAGFMGTHCEHTCPIGSYGIDCLEVCACKSDKFICNAKVGCMCHGNFTADECNFRLNYDSQDNGTINVAVVWIVTIIIILIAIIVLVVIYYRRQIHDLGTAAAVEFHAASRSFQSSSYSLENCDRESNVYNDLEQSRTFVAQNYNLVYTELSTDPPNFNSISYEKYGHRDNASRFMAHLFDDIDEEPMYDEIEPKKIQRKSDDTHYDHLNHSHSTTSLNSNYHRLGRYNLKYSADSLVQKETSSNPGENHYERIDCATSITPIKSHCRNIGVERNNLAINNLKFLAESPVDNEIESLHGQRLLACMK